MLFIAGFNAVVSMPVLVIIARQLAARSRQPTDQRWMAGLFASKFLNTKKAGFN